MERYLVQRLIRNGREYRMAVVTFTGPDINGKWTVEVEPFEREIHSTVFIPGKAVLVESDGAKPSITKCVAGDETPAPVGVAK